MQRSPQAPGSDKESRRQARADKLAASLRENLLRRKTQARSRNSEGDGGPADRARSANELGAAELEAESVVGDTDAADAPDANLGGDT
jgi:hypothetical protein